MIGTALAIGATKIFGISDSEKEKKLREKFPARTQQAEAQRRDMQAFFQKMKENNKSGEGEQDDAFREVMMGGKGHIKRYSNNAEAVEKKVEEKQKVGRK